MNNENGQKGTGFVNALYILGTLIVLVGVIVLVYQHWNAIGFIGRVLVSLGISAVTYVGGLLLRRSSQSMLTQVMFVISAILAPLGVHVLFVQAGIAFTASYQVIIALVLLAIFWLAYFLTKKNVLVLILIAFGSWAYYALLASVLAASSYGSDWVKWLTMLLGLSYILIGYGYRLRVPSATAVTSVLYGFGTVGVLGAAMAFNSGIWDLVLIALIFGAFYASVYLKSRVVLLLASLFLIIHVVRLTQKYFFNSIGWSASLIICGFLVIVVAYLTVYLNQKFLKKV